MAKLLLLGASGTLGSVVLRQALGLGHTVTALVRQHGRLPADLRTHTALRTGLVDLATTQPADLALWLRGHDALICTAGTVAQGQGFVDLVGRVVDALCVLPVGERPVAWFMAGAGLLPLDRRGRRGVDLPKVQATYWPHRANWERLAATDLDWRLLCPGPMVDQPALGLDRLRVALDQMPAPLPGWASGLPAPLLLPLFAWRVPEMIVPYADAAAFMLAHLQPGEAVARHSVGLALPKGMRGRKEQWVAAAAPVSVGPTAR